MKSPATAMTFLTSLVNCRQRLLVHQPFIGMVLMHLELAEAEGDHACKTASTDGSAIYINRSFWSSLNSNEQLFVMAHEAWHCVMLHFYRRQNRDRHFFNIAADLELHFILKREHMKEPFVLPHNPAWEGLSAEEIYERLQQETWIPSSSGHGTSSAHLPPNDSGEGFDRHVYEGDSPVYDSQRRSEKLRNHVIQAAHMYQRFYGDLPAHLQAMVTAIGKPKIPWQQLLRQWITSAYASRRSWLPPARRFVHRGLYLPSRHTRTLHAVVAIDTSGSARDALPLFFAELNGLLRSFGNFCLTVIQCDDVVQDVQQFTEYTRLPEASHVSATGFGGTSFIPTFEYLHTQRLVPDILIYFTDGYGEAPPDQPNFPVLWLLTDNHTAPAPWGKTIIIPENH